MYSAPSARNSMMNLCSGVFMKRSLSRCGSGSSSSSCTRNVSRRTRSRSSTSSFATFACQRAHQRGGVGLVEDEVEAALATGDRQLGADLGEGGGVDGFLLALAHVDLDFDLDLDLDLDPERRSLLRPVRPERSAAGGGA